MTRLRNVAFSYDNALALMAFTAAGDWRRAGLLADAFVYAQQHDRIYGDGRLRNAYQAGDLVLPPGWKPNHRIGTVRMPGWWDASKQNWFEDIQQVSSYDGDMAWVLLALINYYDARGGEQYRNAAIALGEWIEDNTRSASGPGGYTGGVRGWETDPANVTWKSTEHNLDLMVAFARLAIATGDPKWWERSDHARQLVDAMWNAAAGHYWTGTQEDGATPNQQAIPLDAQSWATLAFGPNPQTRRAIDFATTNHLVTASGFSGFDFDTDRDQPWFEGTGQMALAYNVLGRTDEATHVRDELRKVQIAAPNANDMGIVAATRDGLTTGFGWEYFNRLHVGATGWFIFQELGYNPYWPSHARRR
ncbi:MAG: hypothetical protein IPK16_01550 [Anaerolineales bacterium]|nr:hypothetical protein [Anaerolineales bacterium]